MSADRDAITDLIYRYCRVVDQLDHARGYTIWHTDGTADYGDGVYQGGGHGFVDFVIGQHGQTLAHSHQVTNIVLELNGDRAASEAYHIDRWSKRDGRWGIDHRLTIRDFDDIRPVTPDEHREPRPPRFKRPVLCGVAEPERLTMRAANIQHRRLIETQGEEAC